MNGLILLTLSLFEFLSLRTCDLNFVIHFVVLLFCYACETWWNEWVRMLSVFYWLLKSLIVFFSCSFDPWLIFTCQFNMVTGKEQQFFSFDLVVVWVCLMLLTSTAFDVCHHVYFTLSWLYHHPSFIGLSFLFEITNLYVECARYSEKSFPFWINVVVFHFIYGTQLAMLAQFLCFEYLIVFAGYICDCDCYAPLVGHVHIWSLNAHIQWSDFWLDLFIDASLLEVIWVSFYHLVTTNSYLFGIALLPFYLCHLLLSRDPEK